MSEDCVVLVSEETAEVEIRESTSMVVVDAGLVGPRGPQGLQGPPGDSATTLSYQHTQTVAVMTVQVLHSLPFKPAGVMCLDNYGSVTEFNNIAFPSDGVIELSFLAPFSGVVLVS